MKESRKDIPSEGAPARKRGSRKKADAAASSSSAELREDMPSPAAAASDTASEHRFADREVPVPQPGVVQIAEEIELPYEQVSLRAYQIYIERGAAPGRELDYWLEAERDLRQKSSRDARKQEQDGNASPTP